mgnify:CR=1 FL=1
MLCPFRYFAHNNYVTLTGLDGRNALAFPDMRY